MAKEFESNLPMKKPKVILKCETCNLDFTSQVVLDTHVAGAKHIKKLKALEILQNLQEEGQVEEVGEATNLKCSICNINLNSSLQLQMHLAGSKHKLRCKRSNVSESSLSLSSTDMDQDYENEDEAPQAKMTKFYCETCGVTLNSDQQLQQHLDSKKHKDKAEGKKPPSKKFFFKNRKEKKKNNDDCFSSGLPLLSESFLPPNTILGNLP